ncbi:MAG: diaminopimelate epimerase [bacterium]|nr:diaminopimelate epimerase [bacterium]
MNVTPRQPSKNVMYFSKYHANGNDLIMVNGIKHPDTPSWWHWESISKLCNRHVGVGADGLIVLLDSKQSDYRMKYFNSDGKEAQMCGNGLRCLGLFIRDQGYPVSSPMTIQTLGGEVSVEILAAERVRVGMPQVTFERSTIPMKGKGECINEELKIEEKPYKITALSVGNPHVVIYGEYDDVLVKKLGPILENHANFPEGINVSFVHLETPDTVRQQVWERGCGLTLSCGSGAVAAVAAGIALGHLPFGVNIRVLQTGGEQRVAIAPEYRDATLEGEAVYVFHGVVEF